MGRSDCVDAQVDLRIFARMHNEQAFSDKAEICNVYICLLKVPFISLRERLRTHKVFTK